MLIFMDLATSGLDPANGNILEIAALRCDAELNPVDGFTCVIKPRWTATMVDQVQDMHTRNGLLGEVHSVSAISTNMAEQELWRWLDKSGTDWQTWAGYGCAFDRAWMKHHMPTINDRFEPQTMDVGSFVKARAFTGQTPCPIGPGDGRAQAGVMAAVAQARWHLSRVVA